MFLRLLSYALLAVFTTAWSLSQAGRQAGRQGFCHTSRKLHEHEQERTDMITTSNDIDFFRGKNCYVSYDMSFVAISLPRSLY